MIRLVEGSTDAGGGGGTTTQNSIDPSIFSSSGDDDAHRNHSSDAAPSHLHILGDRTYSKSVARIGEWRQVIVRTERKRFRKLFQDLWVVVSFF